MICKDCGNTKKFQALITYYEPVEIWQFNDQGQMERFNQPDTGDLEIQLACPVCNSKHVDSQGYDVKTFVERPLQRLSDDDWEAKIKASEQKEG
jgi:hypothetical protein